MKTLKYALVALLVVSTMVSLASDDGFKVKPKKVVSCTLLKAIHTPGLAIAMYQQLDPGFLNNNQLVYTESVTYNGTLYRITGSYDQWKMFFSGKWKPLKDRKGTVYSSN
jgi:hypothetical protein